MSYMKKFYIKSLMAFMALMLVGIFNVAAQETWSYDWPTAASKDKNAGFYNLSDQTLTTQSRVFNGKEWTINVPAGTYLAFTTSSKQNVGKSPNIPEKFTLVSKDFEGVIKQVKVKARHTHKDAAVAVNVGGTDMVVLGTSDTKASTTASTATKAVEHTFVAPAGDLMGDITLTFTTGESTATYYIIYLEVVTEEIATSVADPVITPATGIYDEAQTVTISAEEGAEIYYTLDESDPRNEGNAAAVKYTEPFTLDKTATITAAARNNGEWSRRAKATIGIRQPAGISFPEKEFTIFFPDDSDGLKLNNPNKVKVKYSSSDAQGVAAVASSSGVIWAMGVGDCVITATFTGDDNYLPASCSYDLHVVAKAPLAVPVISPDGGDFNKVVEVTVTGPDDERLTGFNYMISDEEPQLDEYGAMPGSCRSAEGTSFTLSLDEPCTLWVQAKGHLLWSPMVKASFNIVLPVEAAFSAQECTPTAWSCNFDSEEELAGWTQSSGAQWYLASAPYSTTVPAFSSINKESKSSLYHAYTRDYCDDILTTPLISIPEEASLSFWAVYNPVWIRDQDLSLYVIDQDTPDMVWSAKADEINNTTDDANWNEYTVSLAKYAGKDVQLAWRFEGTYGENIMVDDMKITYKSSEAVSNATIKVDDTVHFTDLSTGKPSSYLWSFPGGVPSESTEANPVVTYPTEGVFDVTLTVSNAKGESSTVTREGFVNVSGVAPSAAIAMPEGVYYSPEASMVVPLNTPLTFKDDSKGNPTEWSWTLPGTDTPTATTRDVTVKYTAEGSYDVDLTVKNSHGQSSTYITGIKAGIAAPVWNIPVHLNDQLGLVDLPFFGNYGGSNWLGIEQFGEHFAKPAQKAEISKVNIYFASVEHDTESADVPVVVSVCAAENGMPGKVLASTSLTVKELVDASTTYNDPTEFVFANAVTVEDEFFITVADIPNNGYDNIAMYAIRRSDGGGSAYHFMEDQDVDGNPLGTKSWYYNGDDPVSFAIAPQIKYLSASSGIDNIDADNNASDIDWNAPVDYYTLQGVHVKAENLSAGIYIVRQGSKAAKIAIR